MIDWHPEADNEFLDAVRHYRLIDRDLADDLDVRTHAATTWIERKPHT